MGKSMNQHDYHQAKLDYQKIRSNDPFLYRIQSQFSNYLFQEIGYFPINNGSFGLWLNHGTSDLDLAVGVPEAETELTIKKLKEIAKFKGVRQSTKESVRYVFQFQVENIEIDLGILPPRDYQLTQYGMNACRALMTEEERIIHVWRKIQLLNSGNIEEYSKYKLEPYKKYFDPIFNFIPLL